jgi:hypothetical protein
MLAGSILIGTASYLGNFFAPVAERHDGVVWCSGTPPTELLPNWNPLEGSDSQQVDVCAMMESVTIRERPMWKKMVLAMTIACCCGFGGSHAQVPGGTNAPSFSIEDQRIIKRNPALASLVQRNPWLVRRALDTLASVPLVSGRSADLPAIQQGAGKQKGKRKSDAEPGLDLKRNPDLDEFSRTSPEAAHDLFQLIKRAGRPVN